MLSSLLAVTMTTLVLVATPPAPAEAARARVKYANSAVKATNHARVHRDRVRLRRNRCVQRFANRQARRMANQRRIFHQDLRRVMRRCNLRMAGENVAYGFRSGRRAVRAWMRSRGHRANILRPGYRLLGVAARKRGGDWYISQVFGRRR